MQAVSAAVSFLTRVPVRRAISADDVARSAVLFPFVGAAVGAATGGVALLAHLALSSLLSAALAVTFATVLTGAMHLDALADTADGIGARDPLAAMRDSRLGTFGVAALALDLLIKVAAIQQLLSGGVLPALIAAGALSRATSVVLAGRLPYVRESGTGGVLRRPSRLALVVCAPAAPVALPFGLAYRRWLGGVTGDLLGAAIELTETAVLVVAAAVA